MSSACWKKASMADFFVHEHALCESPDVGAGTRVWAFAHVMKGARIGTDCNICDHVFVETGAIVGNRVTIKNNALIWDGVEIGDDVFIGPNAVFTNDPTPRVANKISPDQLIKTRIGDGASVGANATVVCGVTIGEGAFIGAGTVVIHDVAPYAAVVGNPARQIGYRCACGHSLGDDLQCSCGRRYRLIDPAGLAQLR